MNFKTLMMCLAILAVAFTSCKDDPVPIENLKVLSIQANGTSFEDGSAVSSDLNGSSAAIDVALNSTIAVTFDKNIDQASANGAVTLSSDAGSVAGIATASATGLTIDPENDLERGTTYTLSISGLKAEDTGNFTAISRSFTTEGRAAVVPPNSDNQIAYFNFDGSVADQTATFGQVVPTKITFGEDRFGQGNSTAAFDGDESIIEVMGADQMMANKDFTLSFWVKTNSTDHLNQDGNPAAFFVLGLAAFEGFQFEIPSDFGSCKLAMSYEMADGTYSSEDLWFPGNGEDKDNGGWQGWDFAADLTGSGGVEALIKDKWTHIICTYNATSRQGRMYINGELMKSQDFNLWPETAPKKTAVGVGYDDIPADFENILALGFIKSIDSPKWAAEPWGNYFVPTSNHFKGDLDDIRVFSAPYSEADAKALYDAEK